MEEITLSNVNWFNRQDAVEAFRWYGRLEDKQAYVDTLTKDEVDLLARMLAAAVSFRLMTHTTEFDATTLYDLAARLLVRAETFQW